MALLWAGPDEPIGNRRLLGGMAALLLVVAAWGLAETWREVTRVRSR